MSLSAISDFFNLKMRPPNISLETSVPTRPRSPVRPLRSLLKLIAALTVIAFGLRGRSIKSPHYRLDASLAATRATVSSSIVIIAGEVDSFERLRKRPMQQCAIILCGGKSSRMGRDKATLPFGPELMLQRVIRLLGEVVDQDHIVAVAAPDQPLPPLPGVTVVRDRCQGRGPLEGISAGLDLISPEIAAVYVTSCDVPLLVPAFLSRGCLSCLKTMSSRFRVEAEQFHPLAAVYRPSILTVVRPLLLADKLRPRFLFDEVDTRSIPVDESAPSIQTCGRSSI